MKRKGVAQFMGILIVVVVVLLLVFSGSQLRHLVPASLVNVQGCDWQPLEIDGQTFSSLQELQNTAQAQGTSIQDLENRGFTIREPTQFDVVEVKPSSCGTNTVN